MQDELHEENQVYDNTIIINSDQDIAATNCNNVSSGICAVVSTNCFDGQSLRQDSGNGCPYGYNYDEGCCVAKKIVCGSNIEGAIGCDRPNCYCQIVEGGIEVDWVSINKDCRPASCANNRNNEIIDKNTGKLTFCPGKASENGYQCNEIPRQSEINENDSCDPKKEVQRAQDGYYFQCNVETHIWEKTNDLVDIGDLCFTPGESLTDSQKRNLVCRDGVNRDPAANNQILLAVWVLSDSVIGSYEIEECTQCNKGESGKVSEDGKYTCYKNADNYYWSDGKSCIPDINSGNQCTIGQPLPAGFSCDPVNGGRVSTTQIQCEDGGRFVIPLMAPFVSQKKNLNTLFTNSVDCNSYSGNLGNVERCSANHYILKEEGGCGQYEYAKSLTDPICCQDKFFGEDVGQYIADGKCFDNDIEISLPWLCKPSKVSVVSVSENSPYIFLDNFPIKKCCYYKDEDKYEIMGFLRECSLNYTPTFIGACSS